MKREAFDDVVEPLRRDHFEVAKICLEQTARARDADEVLLPWRGVLRTWKYLDSEQRAALKAYGRAIVEYTPSAAGVLAGLKGLGD